MGNLNNLEMIDEALKKNKGMKSIKEMLNRFIVIISPSTEKYENDEEQLKYHGNLTISKQLVIDFLMHDDSYSMIKNAYVNNVWPFGIFFLDDKGKYKEQYIFQHKMDFPNLLKQINVNDYPNIKERYKEILNFISFENYINEKQNAIYNIIIDNCRYDLPVVNIFNFLNLNDNEFMRLFNSQTKTIYNMPFKHFIYAVCKYYEDNKLDRDYDLGDLIKSRIDRIKSSKEVDIEMVNQYNDTDFSKFQNYKVNKDLEQEILKDLPDNFSDLEKAIYVYIKMCKLLTYDDEYFAVNQKGLLANRHKMIENIANISLSNNRVVCYEFNLIYAYMLEKLSINYANFALSGLKKDMLINTEFNEYGEGHMFLKFRCGKFLVKADSVTSILHGDIMQAKLNQPLQGLACENVNDETRKEFSTIFKKVYKHIADCEEKISKNEVEKYETFEEILGQFKKATDKIKPVSFDEKIDILIKKINTTKLKGIDAYSYLLQLRKILFTKEQQKNIMITIVRNANIKNGEMEKAEAVAIISIINYKEDRQEIKRYLFKPGYSLKAISLEDLKQKFNDKTMGYIEMDDPLIPGIKRGV